MQSVPLCFRKPIIILGFLYLPALSFSQSADYSFANFKTVQATLNPRGMVSMDWTILEEQNISHYEIEMFKGEESFKRIGFLNATGNNMMDLHYHFTDQPKQKGNYFYRIKAVLQTGEVTYSEVIRVYVAEPVQTFLIPNRHYAKL